MITLLCSVNGAPGVTTTTLGLAEVWPRHVLVIDTDHQRAALTASFGAEQSAEPGLLQVAMAAAHPNTDLVDMMWKVARALPGDSPSVRRLLIPGPLMPWNQTTITARWPSIAPALRRLSHTTGADILIDLGRLPSPTSPQTRMVPPPLLEVADHVCVLIEPSLYGLVGSDAMLQGVIMQAEATGRRDRVELIRRQPRMLDRSEAHVPLYSTKEIIALRGVEVIGQIPTDSRGAAVITHTGARDKRWMHSALQRACTQLADNLISNTHEEQL